MRVHFQQLMNLTKICVILILLAGLEADAQDNSGDTVGYIRPLFDFDYSKRVFKLTENQKQNENKFLRFSVFTGHREGVEPIKRAYNFNMGVEIDGARGTIHQRMYNASIEEMLTHGFNFIKPSHVILDVKDPSKYRYHPSLGSKLEWMRKNTYCYELMLPVSAIKDVKMVDDDVARHFGLRFARETREVKALVLVKNSKEYSKQDSNKVPSSPVLTLAKFEDLLYDNGKHILFNRTGEEDPLISLGLSADELPFKDLVVLKTTIQKYGLDLKEENMKIKFYVIKEIR